MDNTINNINLIAHNYFEVMRKKAESSTRKILNNEFDDVFSYISRMESGEDKNNATINFITELSKACYDICIFNIPEVIEHLNKSLLTEKETKWLIPSNELEKVLSELETNNYYILNRIMTYETIRQYLNGKIWLAMIEKFRIRFTISNDQSYYDFAIQELKKNDRRLFEKSVFDSIWVQLKKITKPYLSSLYGDTKELLTHFQNIKSKESDKILLQIYFQHYIPINKDEKVNTKLRLLFPLYALVLKERKWQPKRFMFGKKIGQIDNRDIDKIMWKFVFKR
jgi:hypothetical protein